MKELDDLVKRYNNLYVTIFVKGRPYNANNPYVLNKINNLLTAGKLSLSDLRWFDKELIKVVDDDYIFYPALEDLADSLCKEYEEAQNGRTN